MKYTRGKNPNSGFKKGYIPWNKGTIGLIHPKKGKIPWNKGLKGFRAGEKRPYMSKKGKENPCWIKDRSLLQRYNNDAKDRRSYSYNFWRNEVKRRDNYKCKINNKDCNGRLEVHHILGYTDHPELRYDINNGITLCRAHHPKKRAEEKRLIPTFIELVSVSKILN